MKVFVAGPRAVSHIDEAALERLKNLITKAYTVIIGDADGVDKAVQQYLYNSNYRDVIVYASDGKARNNIGGWPVDRVEPGVNAKGFEFYAAKDMKMARDADYGYMVWNGLSKGTLNNIINLTRLNKSVLIYLTPNKRFYTVNSEDTLKRLVALCGTDAARLYSRLISVQADKGSEQLSLLNGRV